MEHILNIKVDAEIDKIRYPLVREAEQSGDFLRGRARNIEGHVVLYGGFSAGMAATCEEYKRLMPPQFDCFKIVLAVQVELANI